MAGPGVGERAHLSIGEVLSLLQDEFPDVTISKIRFLESQGLLDPERTPSGYRKFYQGDIERLRWILRQQKENFLPLKVIKDRLREADEQGLHVPSGHEPVMPEPPLEPDEPAPAAPAAAATRAAAPASGPAAASATSPAPVASSTPATPDVASAVSVGGGANPLDSGPTAASFMVEELAEAAGLTLTQVRELERFGLLEGRPVGRDTYYDGDALVIAKTAAGFLQFGIEARHLRMYKVAAEREAGFFEQVITPLLKQRNPRSRQQAVSALGDLARLGEVMRAALLRGALAGTSPETVR